MGLLQAIFFFMPEFRDPKVCFSFDSKSVCEINVQ